MSDGMDGSVTALATPEFSIKRILRPFKGFEQVYQGQRALTPICLCERNQPYDPIAKRGTVGYDPNLVYGVPGQMGTRCSIELPFLIWTAGGFFNHYRYTLNWRLRNTRDHNTNPEQRVPYHVAKSGAGVPETLINPGPRVPIYGIVDTAVYAQTEPPIGPGIQPPARVVLHPLWIEPQPYPCFNPLMPDNSPGAVQQGIIPSVPLGTHKMPFFLNHEVQSIGDDLVITIVREEVDPFTNWDFAPGGVDHDVSIFFGNGAGVEYEDLGVLLSWGISP